MRRGLAAQQSQDAPVFTDGRRDQVVHYPRLFNAGTITAIRSYFDTVEPAKQARILGPRDEKAHRLGTGTDSFRLDARWYDMWRTVSERVVQDLRPYTWVIYPVQIRHISRPEHLVPWHQDVGYQALLGRHSHRQVITCFVPMDYDADRAATLEFAIGEFPLLHHAPQGDHGACIIGAPFARTVKFDTSFGDALIFGDHAPHRTVVPRGGRIERRSFEFRMIDPADAVPDKDYFDLDRRCFVRTDGAAREVA